MTREAPGLARVAVVLATVLMVTSIPGNSSASVLALNYLEGRVSALASPLEFYDYQAATVKTHTSQADFDTGTYTNTDGASSPGDVVLAAVWWDANWTARECFTVDNTAGTTALTNYPIQVTPSFAPTTDIRSVDATDTVQPHWVEGATVWTLVPSVAAGGTTSFCLYYNATLPVTDLSNQPSVFDPGLQNDYVQLAGNGPNVVFYSYVDNNIIYDGATYTVLDAGQTATFATGGTGSVFQTLGPVSHRVDGNANETLSPYWWKGTEFIIPTTRSNQDFFIHATDADATVNIYNGTGLVASQLVTAGSTWSWTGGGDVTGNRTGVVTSDQPVLVGHVASNGGDTIAMYPSISTLYGPTLEVFGVKSRQGFVGSNTAGNTVNYFRSNGTSTAATVNAGLRLTTTPNLGGALGGGAADAYRVTGTSPIGAISQRDNNGSESTTWLPSHQLSNEYIVPTQARYLAVNCVPGTTIDVGPYGAAPANSYACNGTGRGHLNVGTSNPAGTWVRSADSSPFFLYYEHQATNDETSVLGPGIGEPQTPAPLVVTPTAGGGYAPSGTWVSPVIDTAVNGVYGILEATGNVPAGTTLTIEIATSNTSPPTVWTGPFTVNSGEQIIDYAHDGDRYIQIRANLATTNSAVTPRLSSITTTCDLPLVAASGIVPVPVVAGTSSNHHVVRVKTADATVSGDVNLRYETGTNLGNLNGQISTSPGGVQIGVTNGPVGPTSGPTTAFDPANPHSILLNETTTAAGINTTVSFAWQLEQASGPNFEHDLTIEIQS